MSTIEKGYWDEVIDMLFSVEYKHLHRWYSSVEGWCYVSYKGKRTRIDWAMTLYEIKKKLDEL